MTCGGPVGGGPDANGPDGSGPDGVGAGEAPTDAEAPVDAEAPGGRADGPRLGIGLAQEPVALAERPIVGAGAPERAPMVRAARAHGRTAAHRRSFQ